ncbi:NAD(P)-binding protein [Pseudonocardia sp. MCCB 268]|nr:NAD(P)-binding protein [Pseudonocardia cytotoxica]
MYQSFYEIMPSLAPGRGGSQDRERHDGNDAHDPAQDGELRAALEDANIPTLLLVLAHLTGDRSAGRLSTAPAARWRPTTTTRPGCPRNAGARCVSVPSTSLTAVRDGALEPGAPPGRTRSSTGCPCPSVRPCRRSTVRHWPRRAVRPSIVPRLWPGDEPPARREDLHVVVIGAGEGGVCAAAALKAPASRSPVIERHDRVGGVWLENSYPGAGVDTRVTCTVILAQQYGWSRYFAKQPEILEYLRRCARDRGLLEHIRFRTEVTAAVWDDEARNWRVTVRPAAEGDGPADDPHAGEEIRADVVISAVGQLNRPARPDIPGLADFPDRCSTVPGGTTRST